LSKFISNYPGKLITMLPLSAILRFMRVGLVSLKTIERLGRLSGPAAMGFALAAVAGVTAGTALGQTRIATTATLSVTSGGGAVTTVASGSVVTLTATVNAGGIPVTPGQVNFCDASAAFCTDIHLLGTAQLTGAGTAIMKFRPGLGTHSYKAVFPGTNSDAGSSSGASALAVTGTPYPLGSATTIAETGSWGSYALTATVTEYGGTAAPTGSVSFLDTSEGNSALANTNLGSPVAGIHWPTPLGLSLPTNSPSAAAVGDFNGDW
jgi:Bacterial Ig-like domain (group 3)